MIEKEMYEDTLHIYSTKSLKEQQGKVVQANQWIQPTRGMLIIQNTPSSFPSRNRTENEGTAMSKVQKKVRTWDCYSTKTRGEWRIEERECVWKAKEKAIKHI
jgi:hypothetical protein